MYYNFIVVEGNIGAGKTSLVTKLAEEYNAKSIFEQFAENPFLPKFYKNPERFAFPVELSFLADRYKQLKEELSSRDLFKSFTIADYYFMKSLIFASNTLQQDEYKLYRQIFDIIYLSLPKPDLFVFLHLSSERLLENIKKRGRDYEQEITKGYLEGIQKSYFDFFRQHPEYRFLVIDTSGIDFVGSPEDYRLISNAIIKSEYPKGITRLIL